MVTHFVCYNQLIRMSDTMSDTLFLADTISPEEVKFGLFVKTHETRQIAQTLEHIMLLPPNKRIKWAEEYHDFLDDLLDSFLDDSMLAMDGLQLDQEALNLSAELVTTIREVMTTLQAILSDARTLES